MTLGTNSHHGSVSCQGARVAEWKAELQSFFNGDWVQLRDLMMKLEEESWKSSTALVPALVPVKDAVAARLPIPRETLELPQNPEVTGAERIRPSIDRLTELAELIEHQVKLASNNRNQQRGSIRPSQRSH